MIEAIITAAVFIAICVLYFCRHKIAYLLNIPPSTFEYVKVFDKERIEYRGHQGFFVDNYRVTFEFTNRKIITLITPRNVYDSISVGNKGVLVYSGKKFRDFHLNKTLDEIRKK